MENQNEAIKINGKILEYGVVQNEGAYQVYLHPGMTVAEVAFNVMVTIRLMMADGYLQSKEEFDALVEKYFTDPQYAPLEVKDEQDRSI